MSFRQFPATDNNGESHVILEFKPDDSAQADATPARPRYELDDGRHLLRSGRDFVTDGGELRLTI